MTDLLVPLCLYVGIFRNIWQRLLLFLFDLIYSVSMATAAVSLSVAARLTLNMCSICWLVICSNSMACLLMVGALGYGPTLLVNANTLPSLPACLWHKLVAFIACVPSLFEAPPLSKTLSTW